jgi:2-succinyl-5-enolpyruvyl-6-hydroxy-3-cyclohexene-1-carboxylate synthase
MSEPDSSHGNAAVISALFSKLAALGVEEYAVAAGARNAPLLAALLPMEKKFYHFFDERSAAFFAMGRCLMTRRPVAVLTTSGTAVAELFPAVMEAYYQALPLVVVSADRPSRYRDSGAPQAVEQPGIFGSYVNEELHLEYDAVSELMISDVKVSRAAGPIHINVCLEEGLAEAQAVSTESTTSESEVFDVSEADFAEWKAFLEGDGELVVLVAGIHPDDVPMVTEFLQRLKATVIAEATANLPDMDGLPFCRNGGEKVLASLSPKRVLRIGSVPSWRWWRDLEDQPDIRVMNVSRAGFRGLARTENVDLVPWRLLEDSSLVSCHSSWVSGAGFSAKLDTLLAALPHSELAWMRHLSQIMGENSVLMLGNSLPIREWNLAAGKPKSGLRCFANRGANGIDGLVSTWLGLSADVRESWLVVGDLSALYDLSAPWIVDQLKAGKRRLVVINNGGGKIFSRVGWLKNLGEAGSKVMENAHTLSFEPWAKLWGLDYKLITKLSELQDDEAPTAIWEVRPDEAQTKAFWDSWQITAR